MVVITLVPTRLNDGSAVAGAEIREILDGFAKQFGGFTVDGPVEGCWFDEAGKEYREPSLRVTVELDRDKLADIREYILAVGRRLGQKAMYIEVRYFDGVTILPVPE